MKYRLFIELIYLASFSIAHCKPTIIVGPDKQKHKIHIILSFLFTVN